MGTETKTFEERFKEEQEATEAANKQAVVAETVAETPAAETVETTTTETTETVTTETPAVETEKPVEKTWDEIKAEFEQQEQERIDKEEYEEWKKDQFAQDYRKAKKQGVDVKTFVNGIADIDVSLISDETLFKNSLAEKD